MEFIREKTKKKPLSKKKLIKRIIIGFACAFIGLVLVDVVLNLFGPDNGGQSLNTEVESIDGTEVSEQEIELTPKYANCNLIINTSENIWYDKDNNKIIVIDKKIEHGIITITDEYSGFEKTFIVDVIRKEAILFSCGECGTILKRDSVNENFKELYNVNIYDEFKKYEMHYFLGGGHSYLYYDNEGDIASSVYGKSLEYRLTELEDRYLDQNHNLYGAQIVLKSIYNYNIYGCSKEDVTYTYEKKILSVVYHVEYETIIYINIGDILSLECVIKNVTNDTHVKKEYIDEVYEYIVDLIGIK